MKKHIVNLLIAVLCIACLAACSNKGGTTTTTGDVDSAKEYLNAMYKKDAVVTASDYKVVSVVKIDGVTYDVTWTVDVASGVTITPDAASKITLIDIDEKTPTEINYVLTATIKDADGKTATTTFKHSIPAYKEASWADYAAAAAGDNVVCVGVVNGIISKTNGNSSNCLYFQDSDGGYYVYNMADDPVTLGIKLGMTVKATGEKDIYSGTHEIKNATVEILDSTIKEVTPVDFTDIYKNAESLKDEKLVAQQALLVTVKGVEIGKQDTSSGYLYFKLDGKESYIRISSSVCPAVQNKDAILSAHAEHTGWVADVTGVICVYDGAFYLTPVDANCFNYVGMAEKSDAEKIDFEAQAISFETKYTTGTCLTLATAGTTFDTVKIDWAINENEAATLADDGVVTIVPHTKDTIVTLTATLTCGSETKTVEYSFKVEAPADDLSQAEILKKLAELAENEAITGTQVLQGTITAINTEYSEQYGNITVTIDVNGTAIQCFRLVGGQDLAVGDVITVTGTLKNYKGTVEFDSKCTYSKTQSVEDAKAAVVMKKAYELAESEVMSGTQVVKGTITEITTAYSEQYGNITVVIDVQGTPITCFRLAGGEDLAVGDEIVVTGIIKNYKGTVEFDAKSTYSKTMTVEEAKDVVVLQKAYALAENETMSYIQEVKGTITEITTAYSEQYGNITVVIDVQGTTITCFRLAGGEDLAVGDVITVTGTIKNYKGTVEFDAKSTYVK